MSRKLYVGNLPYETGEQDLRELFSQSGSVDTVNVMRDMATGRARGFAFVEMGTDEGARKAIEDLNGHQLGGRALTVNEARPKPERSGGGGTVPAAVAAARAASPAGKPQSPHARTGPAGPRLTAVCSRPPFQPFRSPHSSDLRRPQGVSGSTPAVAIVSYRGCAPTAAKPRCSSSALTSGSRPRNSAVGLGRIDRVADREDVLPQPVRHGLVVGPAGFEERLPRVGVHHLRPQVAVVARPSSRRSRRRG